MKTEFRNRVFLPIVMPLAILLAMAAFIAVFALTLLHSTHDMSLTLAGLAAFGILFTISLAASQDRLDPLRRTVLAVAVAVPFLIGGIYAAGVVGDIGPEDRMINIRPHEAPEDAVLAAENDQEFCEYDPDADACVEPTELWTVGYQGAEEFLYDFHNLDQGTPHNLSIRELEGDRDDPQPGEEIHPGEIITGPDETTETVAPGLEPGDYYFVCDVHSSTMTGVLEVTEESAEGEDAGGEGGESEA